MERKQKKRWKKVMIYGVLCCIFICFLFFYVKGFFLYQKKYGKDKFTFGATYMTMNNQFYDVLNNEIRDMVEEKGDHLITLDPALNQDKQNEQIQYLLDQQVDLIFLNPVDWKGVEPGLEAAEKAGVPVIVVDAPVYHSDHVAVTIVSDNYQAGVLCAEDMMKQRKQADIVLLTHRGAKSAQDRIRGFLDTIEGKQQYKVVVSADTQGQIERTLPKMQTLLDKGITVDVVMALNDPTAMGALAALDSKNCREGVLVYGVDGSPEAKKLIQDHMLTGTAIQSPKKMGKTAVDTAYELLDGKEVPAEITMSVEMVTEENISDFEVDRWQ